MRKVAWLVAVMIGVGALAGCGTSLQTAAKGAIYKCQSYNTNERCQVN
jgi:hypothetical protein